MSSKFLFRVSVLAAGLLAAGASQAGSFSSSLGEFNGGVDLVGSSQTIGTFSFVIPAGESVISATISGFFGNSVTPDTAGQEIYADGIKVATCVYDTDCWNNMDTPLPWSYTFTAAQLGIFADGKVVLTDLQTDCCIVRLGETTLSGITAAVPEPESYALMLGGMVALAWVSRRRTV